MRHDPNRGTIAKSERRFYGVTTLHAKRPFRTSGQDFENKNGKAVDADLPVPLFRPIYLVNANHPAGGAIYDLGDDGK
jgi:hypothetical protein